MARLSSLNFVSRRTLGSLSVLALCASFLSVSHAQQLSQADRKAKGEIYFSTGDEPPSMDPTKQSDQVSSTWLSHMFEGLMTFDKTGEVVLGAAEKMDISPDGKTYTFTIRKNAKWQDGKALSAKDFEFAFQRLVDPAFASEYAFIAATASIMNAANITAKKADKSTLGAKAISDQVFEVKLEHPVTFFPSLMAFNTFYPIRKDLVDKYGDKFATNVESLIGNGPFKLTKWQKEASMRIEKAPTYWNAAAIKVNAIENPVMVKDNGANYNMYRTGGIDVVGLDAERLKLSQKDKLSIKSFNDGAVFYFEPNQRPGKLFANQKLRKAISLALNRREFINKISAIPGDRPALGLVPDYMPGAKKGSTYRKEAPITLKDGDVAGAQAMIKEYLAETKQTKMPAFTILAGDTSVAKRDAEYFQQYLTRALNAEIKVDSVPFKTRIQKMRDNQFDIVLAGWGPDYLDSMTFMDLFTSTNENNRGGFSSKEFDDLIAKAQTSSDPVERVNFFKKAEQMLIVEKVGVIPYHQRGRAYVTADGLQGVRRTQIGADIDFRFASWSSNTAKK
jgi:oligopeptide transport system substrate-binding protein